MKKYKLIRNRDEHHTSVYITYFYGNSLKDKKMLDEVKTYLKIWINNYNNSITEKEIKALFKNFNGTLKYDVYSFYLKEENE